MADSQRSLSIPPLSGLTAVWWRELYSYATSPVGYVVVALFLVLSGSFFVAIVREGNQATMQPVLQNMIVLLLLLAPIMTMRLISEERKLGTWELLLSKPVSYWGVVLGKFAAAKTLLLIMLLPTFAYLSVLQTYGNPDMHTAWTGYLGLFLIGCAFLSLGLFASSLTEHQVIAAVVAFVLVLLFWILGALFGGPIASQERVLTYLSLSEHIDPFLRGIIDVGDIVYLLSFTFFWIFVSVRLLQARTWNS